MKYLILGPAVLLSLSSFANPVQVEGKATVSYDRPRISHITIQGKAAKALFDNLDVPVQPGLGFEGNSNSFKLGENVRCNENTRFAFIPQPNSPPPVTTYSCSFVIDRAGKAEKAER